MGDLEDLEEFMEAVTTYRCKFCPFTATTTGDMAQHVRATHIVSNKSRKPVTVTNPPDTEKVPTSLAQSHGGTSDASAESVSTVQVALGPTEQLNTVNQETSGDMASLLNYPRTPLPQTLATCNSATNTVVTSNSDSLINQNFQVLGQLENGQILLRNSQSTSTNSNELVQVLVENVAEEVDSSRSQGFVSESGESYIIGREDGMSFDPKTYSEMKETNIENFAGEDDDDASTKELYLCGTCSEGFPSIQDCKAHMIEVHDVSEFQTGQTGFTRKVDAGTQMEPKKRGRKKKVEAERMKQEKLDKEADHEDEDDEVSLHLSDSDEDWTSNISSYSTRSRRNRRPPQALRQDYYLGRRKNKEERRPTPVDVGIKCNSRGCGLKFATTELMEKHLEFHIDDATSGPNIFKCTSCEETFPIWKALKIHAWKSHTMDLGLLKCPHCDFRTENHSKLKIHMAIHGSDRPYVCGQCGKAFKQLSQLKNHEYTHIDRTRGGSDQSQKACDICGRMFVSLKCMKIHRDTVHSGRKPFKCRFCDHACSRKAMLVLHERTHTGEKPFKCTMCAYVCSDHNSLRRHKMRHSGLKPYQCPHCPYSCIQAISLKVHVKNKHPGMGGIFCCNLCLFRSVSRDQFNKHVQDHQNGLIPSDTDTLTLVEGRLVSQTVKTKKGQRRPLMKPVRTIYSGLNSPAQQNIMCLVQQPNMSTQHIIEVPVSSGSGQEQMAHLQIELGDNTVREDLNKIANFEALSDTQSDTATANLIYSALSAISLQSNNQFGIGLDPEDLVSKVESGDIQTSIETNSNKDGVTTHTITFQLPDGGELLGGVTLQESSEEKDAVTMIEVENAGSEWQNNPEGQNIVELIESGS
ncbi:zinc finger and SCAN domain-containing protein 20-like [Mya arenaria]|uniref:zinc finger and SCAN domain-containing protein 20-like n=1 Tax=Mya arenaria TaxID=6604 RepID=UPI0022E1F666|nr:zinc finger and SCAN domain-containing protein 20-like [Mya arenaria]XP_052819187.1 zinc finger and SCAN domain-containing protein 20-like [Mya arenaria]XP_052819188.1 zinc finger and SCAN domain-containing protein 20-like [Mya arenaria]XP_052819189.1 zinc finger and SCAN domain-containing protein 20-like [Mya arenaria]